MKFLCETQVIDRISQIKKNNRPVKSTLAVGMRKGAKTVNNNNNKEDIQIILFTPQCKIGLRFTVYNNIEKFHTKFIQDGKATISFINPPSNLMIKGDPVQLKSFLQVIKMGSTGQHSMQSISLGNPSAVKSVPQTKMTILKRGDYPIKGFPKTTQILTISGINLLKISFDILSLKNLTKLNLSDNNLTKIPIVLGNLPLVELNLNHNHISGDTGWKWMLGKTLQKSLRELDLSANDFKYFPQPILKFKSLVTLKLNNNHIRHVPFGIRRLNHLRFFHIFSNELESLPSVFDYKPLEILDIWGNNFQPCRETAVESAAPNVRNLNIAPLWLMAARVVQKHKLPISESILPWTLVDKLEESPKCACDKLCYYEAIHERAALAQFENTKNLIFNRDRCVCVDVVLCSITCSGRKKLLL